MVISQLIERHNVAERVLGVYCDRIGLCDVETHFEIGVVLNLGGSSELLYHES